MVLKPNYDYTYHNKNVGPLFFVFSQQHADGEPQYALREYKHNGVMWNLSKAELLER